MFFPPIYFLTILLLNFLIYKNLSKIHKIESDCKQEGGA